MNAKSRIFAASCAAAMGLFLVGCAETRGVKISERFGFDPVDATKNLQAALDSGEKVLIVDKQAGDWFVRPLNVRGKKDITLILEDGVCIFAKRGEFKSPYISLITFDCCTNIVIRGASRERSGFKMWHEDYYTRDKRKPNAKGYMWSEWRHGLSFLSCENVTLEHLYSNDSGGDGLYISTSGRVNSTPGNGHVCKNFVVRDCIFDHNNRQGISVIGVDGLLVEDVLMCNTFGTAPAAGIDLEPNRANESISGVVLRRCQSINNEGNGFEFYMNRHDATSKPMDALFEDCVAISNRFNFCYSSGNDPKKPEEPVDYGKVVFDGCRFVNSRENAVAFWHRPNSKGTFIMRNCVLENNCTQFPSRADLSLTFTGHGIYEPDSYTFENVKVIRTAPGKVLGDGKRKKPYRGKPSSIHGTIDTVIDGKPGKLVYDDLWNKENHPYVEVYDVAVDRVSYDLAKAEIVDKCPDKLVQVANPIFYRAKRNVVFYADRAKEVHFVLQQTLVGKRDYNAPYHPIRVMPYGEKKALDPNGVKWPVDPKGSMVSFKVPRKGFYKLDLATGGNGVAVLATDVPLAYDVTESYVNFIAPCAGPVGKYRKGTGDLSFYVPAGKDFSILHIGEGGEMVGVEIVDPAGKVVRREPCLTDLNALTVKAPAGGLWTLRTFDPKEGSYEDFDLSISGTPGWFFVTPEKYWK